MAPPAPSARTVILRHTLPDGSWHLDWLIERPGSPQGSPLLTFRTQVRPDDASALEFAAERLPDHRHVYLDYEGLVSGNRGDVRRVVSGVVENLSESEVLVAVSVRIEGRSMSWEGTSAPAGGWVFRRQSGRSTQLSVAPAVKFG